MIRRRCRPQLSLACCYLNSSPPPSQSLRKSDGQLCRQFHVGGIRVWFGDRHTFLAKSVEVERNCLSHVMFHFFMGPASRNTSWEIWTRMFALPNHSADCESDATDRARIVSLR